MKACRFCAEEIQDDAIACRHCGREQVTTEAPTTAMGSRGVSTQLLMPGLLGLVGGIVLAISTFLEWGDQFTPMDLEAEGLALVGLSMLYLVPPIVCVVAAGILLGRRQVRLWAGVLLGSSIVALTLPIGSLFISMEFGSDVGPGLILGMLGGVGAFVGGVLAAVATKE
jgi:hypothetical protein